MKKIIVLSFLIAFCSIAYSQSDTLIRKTYVYNKVQYREVYHIKPADYKKVHSDPHFSWASWSCPATVDLYQIKSDGKYYMLKSGIVQEYVSSSTKTEIPPHAEKMLKANKIVKP